MQFTPNSLYDLDPSESAIAVAYFWDQLQECRAKLFRSDGKPATPFDQSNAESMAFRRAAARFGLGLSLYDGEGK